MSDDETEMKDHNGERKLLRDYLLGAEADEAVLAEIEMRLLADGDFADDVARAENELIEEFLDDDLGPEESDRFLNHFLASPERKKQLRLTKNLRQYSANSLEEGQDTPKDLYRIPQRTLFQWPVLAGAVGVLLAVFGIWWFSFKQTDTDRGLAEMRKAYSGTRPIEARITAMPDYVPYTETRGPAAVIPDAAAHDRADRYLQDATRETADARPHHALGLLYLADKKYDRAFQEFEKALAISPNDASLQSDVGAAYLTLAKNTNSETQGAKVLESLNESLEHLDLAIAAAPNMPEPRFNKALCLEALKMPEQAGSAWRDYLERDSKTKWADEAKRRLAALDANPLRERTADETEKDFLTALSSGDDPQARSIAAGGRELIRDKYLPLRLPFSYVDAPDERRDELLRALQYDGKLESEMTGDPYAKEVAHFYASVTADRFPPLREAHRQVRVGLADCLSQNYDDAGSAFDSAERQFTSAGDIWNASISRYLSSYAAVNRKDYDAALKKMLEVKTFAASGGYLWLEATVTHSIGIYYEIIREPTQARQALENALSIAVKLGDPYAKQRNRIELAQIHSISGQSQKSLTYLSAVLGLSDDSPKSIRQRYRTLSAAGEVFSRARLFSAAKACALESVTVADQLPDQFFRAQARHFAGVALAAAGDYAEARKHLTEGRAIAATIGDLAVRNKLLAFSSLKFGYLELHERNYTAAERYFGDAANYYDTIDLPFNREEAHNGLLMTYLGAGNTEALKEQIPANITITEEYRSRVSEEEQRISYLDSRENVYDIAADFEYSQGDKEAAYSYAEMSSSRGLLDRIEKTGELRDGRGTAPVPLGVGPIVERIPPGVQIVQYSILSDRVLVWLLSRGSFDVQAVKVDAFDLDQKAASFNRLLSRPGETSSPEAAKLGRELYDLLILPIRERLGQGNEICFVPSKALFTVPFAALVSPEGRPLIADFAIVYSPSANVFLVASENAARKGVSSNETLLAVGDPAFDREHFADLTYVEDASTEAADIASIYDGQKALVGPMATKRAFLTEIAAADVIHFAGHYVTAPGMPMSSHLVFAASDAGPDEDTLTNRELAELSLPKTRLVVLAACETGLESSNGGEGLTGMSRSFLAAGVPIVVASQWNVESAATAQLMGSFHRYRHLEHEPTASALRRAQIDMINDPSGRFSAPFYWAAFAVFGGHSLY